MHKLIGPLLILGGICYAGSIWMKTGDEKRLRNEGVAALANVLDTSESVPGEGSKKSRQRYAVELEFTLTNGKNITIDANVSQAVFQLASFSTKSRRVSS